MFKGYKFRLLPNQPQIQKLNQAVGNARFVFNHFLEMKMKTYQETGISISHNDISALLTQMKKDSNYSWLKETPATSLIGSLQNLDAAYRNFFIHNKGFPKFKSKRGKQNFYLSALDLKNSWQNHQCLWINPENSKDVQVKLGTLGWFKLNLHREMPESGKIKCAHISKEANGEWYIAFRTELQEAYPETIPVEKAIENSIGIDFGLKTFLTLSNGEQIYSPKHYQTSEKKLAKLQRSLSKKTKGSNNSLKTKQKLVNLHRKIANQREDYLRKLAYQLASRFDLITIENLNIQGMSSNHRLAKSVMTSGWAKFVTFLREKCREFGKHLIWTGRWFASSRIIYDTGEYRSNMTLKCRTLTDCHGNQIDRDVNAAKNINYWGQHFITTGELLATKDYLALYS
ncbi:RNA-guided endonuclease InsQ/TnpB family protein [Ewingella americana]|uniref:Transposase n=1 Tax=Ewingella americana TaxID=41202 RepID=A0A502GDF4_9GAMM|nr:RNA-guided endonuclease TnpB family protein [Ewingella americana]TPG60129.1 transposase [Ewingella americana]